MVSASFTTARGQGRNVPTNLTWVLGLLQWRLHLEKPGGIICTSWYIKAILTGDVNELFLNRMKIEQVTPPLGRPREFETEKALDRAMQVFWRKGYLGTSLSDLTEAMGINRPSLYAAFGNKESLFRKVLDRYSKGPSNYLTESLLEPTARAVVEQIFQGVVNLLSDSQTPTTCLWVHGALSCGDDPLREEFFAQRAVGLSMLSERFKRAIAEGDLPVDTDAEALAKYVQTVNFGLTVQSSTGATRNELLQIVEIALKAWPN